MFNGLTKGLKMMADALSMRVRALSSGNTDCSTALDAVFAQWFMEATGVAIGAKDAVIKVSGWALLVSDPFAGSRQMFRAVQAQFPNV